MELREEDVKDYLGKLDYADHEQLLIAETNAKNVESRGTKRLWKWRKSIAKYSFQTNWGKSVGVLKFRGRGARQVAKNLKTKGEKLVIDIRNQGETISLVKSAKNRGSMINEAVDHVCGS